MTTPKVTNLKSRIRALAEELDLKPADVEPVPYDQALLIARPYKRYRGIKPLEAKRRVWVLRQFLKVVAPESDQWKSAYMRFQCNPPELQRVRQAEKILKRDVNWLENEVNHGRRAAARVRITDISDDALKKNYPFSMTVGNNLGSAVRAVREAKRKYRAVLAEMQAAPEYHVLMALLEENEITSKRMKRMRRIHAIANDLYFICGCENEDSKHFSLTLREAFDGKEPVDRTQPYDASEGEYLVLTDREADQRTREYIKDSLWAFNPEFLIKYTDLPEDSIPMIRSWQESKCESANETLLKLVGNRRLRKLSDDAIAADGRGHFLAGYDNQELRRGRWCVYRTN